MIETIIAVAVIASVLLPSPTTIAKFRPWEDADPVVRWTFFLSLGVGVILVGYIATRRE